VNVTADLETPRPGTGEAFSDAITIAFGEPGSELYGLARAGLADGEASGLGLLFQGGRSVAMRASFGSTGWQEMKISRKKSVNAMYVEEATADQMTAAVFWDGKKYRYQPLGSSME